MSRSSQHPYHSVYALRLTKVLVRAWTLYLLTFMGAGLVQAQVPGPVAIQGNGGTITENSGNKIHTFSVLGSDSFTPPPGISAVDVLVVGGGGGGARTGNNEGGGGGGSGGLVDLTGVAISPSPTGTAVVVGAAGLGATVNGNGGSGGQSRFNATVNRIANGGGGGGQGGAGLVGGSGGGGGANGTTSPAGGASNKTMGLGNAGGQSFGSSTAGQRAGGGGGGAGQAGFPATSQIGGDGGAGASSSITGSPVTYAAGGGGAGLVSGGAGGSSGLGGAGATNQAAGGDATGFGSGGGAGRRNRNGGNGSQGIVIVRYAAPLLEINTQPSATAGAGEAFAQQPIIRLTQSDGVTGIDGVTITASLSSGSGSLGGTLTAVTSGGGYATFTNLSLSGTEGANTIAFNVANATGQVVSNVVTLQSSLTVQTQPPGSVERGATFSTAARAFNNAGVAQNGVPVTVSILSGGGTLNGTLTQNTSGGIATFSNLSISGEPGIRVLQFSSPNWRSVSTSNVTVTASTLAITQQASSTATQGVIFLQQPIVRALDGGGTAISGVEVTATIASGTGTLSGTVTLTTDSNGYATFTDLLIGGNTGVHTLSFAASGWNSVVSNTITVSPPTQFLTMSTQPSSNVDLGESFPIQPVILASDGSPVAGVVVTAAIDSGPGTIGGTLTATTNGSGLASFSGLYITGQAGDHTLRFTSPTWTQAISNTITVQPGTLTVSQQATPTVESGEVFSNQPIVRALDSVGNPISGLEISAAIQTGGGTLTGTALATTDASGFAEFAGLAIIGSPGDRTLRFTATGWNFVDSNPISVVASPLEITQQMPSSVESGVVFSQQPIVRALDGANSPISGVLITATILSGGGSLGGTVTATTDGTGLATFTDLSITGGPGDRVIRFSATDWSAVDSNSITVFSYLTITQQASALVESNTVFPQQPIIEARDGNNTLISGVEVTASVSSGTGTLLGTTSVITNGSGLAAFSNLAIDGPPGAIELTFSASGWGAVVSNTIDIVAAPGTCAYEGGVIGSQLVTLKGCTTSQVSPASTSVPIDVPTGTVAGDLLIVSISSSGNLSVTGPAGWTEITDLSTGGGGSQNLAIYTRIADGTEASSYTFTQSSSVVAYAFMMRYEGASGVVLEATENTGNGAGAIAPALSTALRDTLIVRLIANRNGLIPNPAAGGIISGHRNITQDSAGNADGAGAYVNQETVGSSGTATFGNTQNRWVTQTLGLEPSPVYHYEISHAASHGTCTSTTPITITVRDSYGDIVTDYQGTMTITSSGGTGNYSLGSGVALNFDNLISNDGVAEYTFNGTESGQIVLNFSSSVVGTITFDAEGEYQRTIGSVVITKVAQTENYSLSMVMGACAFRIVHDGNGSVCSIDPITISVVDSLGASVNYTGTINLSTVGLTGGNWTKTSTPSDANGTLDNGASNDGAASYTFLDTDAGSIVINFQDNTVETVNFNITAAGVSAPVGIYDPDFTITACSFRVTHSNSMDVCSPELVTITIVDNLGVTVTGYTGTINLSTTTGYGTWSKTLVATDAEGALTDPIAGDGGATYSFVAADAGVITLKFNHSGASGVVNINVSDGATLDPRNSSSAYDQSITVGLCKFEIAHSGNATACELEAVTFTVRDSLGGLAVDYEGTMTLATNTNHGNWRINTGSGVLTDSAGDDNGVATYQFGAADNGTVILDFSDPHAEIVNFDATDNAIIVDVTLDPNLIVSSCLPNIVGSASCVVGTSTTLAIPAQNPVVNQRSRMVVMLISGASATTISSASFNSQSMTLIRRQVDSNGEGNVTEMWGILDASLPTGAGTYTGSFSGGPSGAAMCMLAVNEVEQAFPTALSPANTGPVNSTAGSGARATDITTKANNSLVVVGTSFDAETFRNFDTPSPDYLSRIFGQFGTPIANPTGNGARFGGSAGRLPTAGISNIVEQLQFYTPAVGTQVVVAFKPLVAGSPLASGYVPVLLEQTFSGNLSYRAIGATLRSTYNLDSPTPLGCNFVSFTTGAAATLSLPAGSTVRAAYLYWAGSGDDALGHVDADVSFGPTGSEVPITADEIFLIDDTGAANDVDYFTGFKEVTPLVSGSGSYTLKNLVVQTGSPWNASQSCAGAWSLIVIFDNASERLRVVNLFQGFQPFQNSSFTLVPRNFRMATNDPLLDLPNGQVTHITLEGDETLNAPDNAEGLGLQTAPNATTFTNITSSLNPLGQEFNSTITRPVYVYDVGTGYYVFDDTGGLNGDGFEIDVAGPQATTGGPRFGNSWGLDVDTHYMDGGSPGSLLYQFAQDGSEAEQITTRYSAEQDLVMLISEIISVTNFPVADLEVTKTQSGTFKVNGTGTYQITVQNNGNGGVGGGYADGEVLVADILPAGLTFATAGDVSGTDWSCSVTLDPGAFSCTYDIAADWTGGAIAGRLAEGEELPPINVTVDIGDSTFFPLRNNNAKNSVRMLHSGGNCPVTANGVIPDPDDCDRAPQFDNFNDLEGGNIDINDLDDKQANNNNVDSVTTVVKGVEVDLEIDKFVEDILEAGSSGVYTLRVTNNGTDATTSTITVTDTEPIGVTFTGVAGTGWSCPAPAGSISCTYAGSLGVGASTDILLTVDVTGADGYLVTNAASVAAGAFNFDTDETNNSDTDITEIEGAPVASQEKFLLSVSSLGGLTTIGGLSNFEDDDYIIYDPVTDTAEMFFDNSALGFDVNDADAVHLLKNGHIVISAKSASTIGTGPGAISFGPGDLVVYDPILGTASLLFDGDTIFGGPSPGANNITAVYVNDDGTIEFAVDTSDPGSTVGSNNLAMNNHQIYLYDPVAGTASVALDVETYLGGVADEDALITGFYHRVDPSDPSATITNYIVTLQDPTDGTTTLGPGLEPITGTIVTPDDIAQIDFTASPTTTTENLFLGDVELGVFESSGNINDLLIDAVHVVEDPYVGHFRISEYGGDASVCSPTGLQLRISKHEGLTHDRDIDYYGSIRITTDTGIGDWGQVIGNGTLNNGTPDDGVAIYTFVPSDGGTVVLSLNQSVAGTVNIDVTNGIAREGIPAGVGSEAPLFTYSEGVTLNYLDSFSTVSYANQDGTNAWSDNWTENDNGLPAGAASGDVRITGGKAVFTRAAGTVEPSLFRSIDLSGATLQSDLMLSFSYEYANLGTFEEFVVEARHTSAAAWQQVALYKRGTTLPNTASGSALSGNLNLSAIFAGTPSATTQIRFRIVQGYTTGATFSIDDVKLTAETSDCNVSPLGVNHYEISINGITNGTYNGVACVGAEVTITGHNAAHTPIEPGAISIYLTTNSDRGNWSRIISGSGVLANGTVDDGAATYTYPANEESVTLRFDYTGPATDPEVVNIDVTDNANAEGVTEDPNYSVSQVGLRILNSGTGDSATPIPLQIAGKPSNVNPISSVLYVQVVNSSGANPGVCEPLFAVGETLDLEFAAQCDDPTQCVTATESFEVNSTPVALIDQGDPVNYTSVPITLTDVGGGVPGAPIVINYSDVGKMYLLSRFDIPFGDNVDPLLATKSGDAINVTSNQFIVRPFGFDIDFSDGREDNGTGDASYAADHNGSLWRIAGEAFDTTISTVAWESGDDTNNDGVPDTGADLSDNHVTPNFDQDSSAGNYSVNLSIVENKVPGGIDGILSNDDFDGFSAGVNTHSVTYNEVGIIDLRADIVNGSNTVIPYLGTANVEGQVLNVGRFYPNVFSVTQHLLTGRADLACTPDSAFTYMNEPFEVELELTAKGLTDSGNYTTVNYRGDYAKLDTIGELSLVAINDVAGASDVDHSTRLANDTLPTSFAGTWSNGVLSLSGNLIFQRNATATPDGPFPAMQIAFKPTDNDGVTIDPARIDVGTSLGVLNVDLDIFPTEPGTASYYLIDEHEFRYGRLIVNNAYGPETEDLALTFLVEYFNGSEFVRNTLDNCSLIDIADLSFVGGTYTGDLNAGETTLTTPDTVTFLNGQTQGFENVPSPSDSPLETSAPGEGNGGTVNITLDLNAAGLSYLGFEWDDADDDYNEDPTGQIEFGQYRMHDRIINWQEIYNRPSP